MIIFLFNKNKMITMAEANLIQSYDVELIPPPCIPGADTWSAKAHLKDDITEVLPYLNSVLKRADYMHDTKILLWESEGKKYAFRPLELGAAPADDREEAHSMIENLVDIVNTSWKNREEITPMFEHRKKPTVMDIYRLLPRTNCKECGYMTCMGYAADLNEGKTVLSKCPNLEKETQEKLLQILQ